MAIERIDLDLCNGCGICVDACEADVIRMDEETRKPKIVYQDDCTLCVRCEGDCPQHAIEVGPGVYVPITTFFGA